MYGQISIQTAPAIVYLAVFRLAPPSRASLLMFGGAVLPVIGATFVLARRQGMMEWIRDTGD